MIEQPFQGIRGKKTASEKIKKIDEGKDTFTVRLNTEEREMLDRAKKVLLIDRDSTALKELAELGSNVIHESSLGKLTQKIIRRIRKGYDSMV